MTIDYSIIDERCIELVKLFNKIGLITKHCCEGHTEDSEFYIMFNESVGDEVIRDLLFKINSYNIGCTSGNFYRWDRFTLDKRFLSNWMYSFHNRRRKRLIPEKEDAEKIKYVFNER